MKIALKDAVNTKHQVMHLGIAIIGAIIPAQLFHELKGFEWVWNHEWDWDQLTRIHMSVFISLAFLSWDSWENLHGF